MFIGSLLDPKSGAKVTYHYQTRGGVPYFPDAKTEEQECACYNAQGKLFTDEIVFDGVTLLNTCVDVVFSVSAAGNPCYLDSICFQTQDPTAFGEIQVLCEGKPVAYKKQTTEEKVQLCLGVTALEVILRINGNWKNLFIGKLDILGAVELEKVVYPMPKEYTHEDGYLEELSGVVAMPGTEFAAKEFSEKYEMLIQKEMYVGEEGNIRFSMDTSLDEEEFFITVTDKDATVRGGSLRAMIYAQEKLLQLCDKQGICKAKIHDKPFMKLRGVHIALPHPDKAEFLRRMIRFVFAPMGYNMVFIQLSATMEYKKLPEINDMWEKLCREYEQGEGPMPAHYGFLSNAIWTQEQIKEICAYIRKFGMQVVPEVQTFGHTQYITTVYPEMAEIEEETEEEKINLYAADAKPEKKFFHCMCPNHPDYYKITFEIMDEIIDVVRPEEYVHVGHDEIYTMGKCPRCKHIPAGEIYAKEVTALRDHLAERGLKVMLWSDMMEEPKYESSKGVSLVPNDVIGLSFTWYFHLKEETNIEDRILEHGFHYMMGNMYSSHYPRFEQRRHNPTLLGAEVSTWVYCDERTYAYEGKIYDFLYSANMMWSEEYSSELRQTYDEILRRRMPELREWVRSGKQKRYHRFLLPMPAQEDPVPFAIRNVCKGAMVSPAELSVQSCADRLVFIHATEFSDYRAPWAKPEIVGDYTVQYEDGTTVEIPLAYGLELCEYGRKHGAPLLSSLFRHEGYFGTWYSQPICLKDFQGEDVTLYEYTWENPYKGKKIMKTSMHAHSKQGNNILLFGLYGEVSV